jgi:hypothetical protein
MLCTFQYMGGSSRGWSTQTLNQSPPGICYLVLSRLIAQLQYRFHDLVDASRPTGVAAGLQTTKGGDGQRAIQIQITILG